MRYKVGHKEQAREKVLEAAGKRLKRSGLNGVGIDGLMAEAGLTSGAFYTHFASKDQLFEEVMVRGLERMRDRLQARSEGGEAHWLFEYAKGYLNPERCFRVEDGCVLPALTTDTSRASDSAKEAYRVSMLEVVDICMKGTVGATDEERIANAWKFLSIIVGAVTIARAMPPGPAVDVVLKSALDDVQKISL
jgi:TetR/AcrR family transcriptional repressor of nem operon